MNTFLCLLFSALAYVSLVSAGCPVECSCSVGGVLCPPGVSTVQDDCGCCKVCAGQLNQDCHSLRPCDHHKGLECNYGNDVSHSWGICRARQEGRTCEYDGRIFQSGESFHAGCQHQCTCVDGAVGCAPLCPAHLPLATPTCPAPRLVRVPGQCCPRLDCHKGKMLPSLAHQQPYPHQHKSEKNLDNDLLVGAKKWDKVQEYKNLAVWTQQVKKCVVQTTDWSPCSRTCGMGVSSRVTNDNGRCKLVKETRLCSIRPCSSVPVLLKKGKKCSRTYKPPEPLRLSHAGCRSARLYRPNYCGTCVDGRCCFPHHTRTATVLFLCPDGERFRKAVMFVRSCKCRDACGHLNEAALTPQHWLHGDTHKFVD